MYVVSMHEYITMNIQLQALSSMFNVVDGCIGRGNSQGDIDTVAEHSTVSGYLITR